MKKLIYIMILAMASSLAVTACTEEDVKPGNPPVGGGGSLDPL